MAITNYSFAAGDKVKITNMFGLADATETLSSLGSKDDTQTLAHIPVEGSLVIKTSGGVDRVEGTDYSVTTTDSGVVIAQLGASSMAATDVATYFYETEKNTEKVWNTGMSAAGDPHADEPESNAGFAIITDPTAFEVQGIAQIRLFRTNQAVLLNPGDSLEIAPTTAAEFFYYAGIVSEFAKVEVTRA